MAYFLPTGRVLRTIHRVVHHGVGMTLVVPGASDVPLVQRATRFLYERLLERGIEIYERQRSMLHSKAMVVDDRWTVVGSCNLDPRSLEINLEFLAVIRSEAMAQAVTEICERRNRREPRASPPRMWPGTACGSDFLDRCAYLFRAAGYDSG